MEATFEYPEQKAGTVCRLSDDHQVTIGKRFVLPAEYVGSFHRGDEFVVIQAWWGTYCGEGAKGAPFIRARCTRARNPSHVGTVSAFLVHREWERLMILDRIPHPAG